MPPLRYSVHVCKFIGGPHGFPVFPVRLFCAFLKKDVDGGKSGVFIRCNRSEDQRGEEQFTEAGYLFRFTEPHNVLVHVIEVLFFMVFRVGSQRPRAENILPSNFNA